MSEELKAAQARIAELEGALSWHEEQRNDMAEIRAELAALKAQEPVAYISGCYRDVIGGKSDRTPLGAELAFVNMGWIGQIPLYASPVSEAKARGVVQWPDADEIMQMAFEEGQPADDASGYCFELEEFDLFIERLMSEVARLNATPVQHVSVPDVSAMARILADRNADACNVNREDNWTIYGQDYIDDVTAMLAAPAAPAADAGLVEALEKLARLGNGDKYGNSDGNLIAQAALAAHSAK